MNTQKLAGRRVSAKLIALLLTAAMMVAALAAQLGGTFAAPGDVVVELQCESGITSSAYTLEVGATKKYNVTYLYKAYSSDSRKLGLSFVKGSATDNLTIEGKAAGVVSVSYGTETGFLSLINYQVTDSRNISKYTLKNNGELYFSIPKTPTTGASKPAPVVVNTAANEGNLNTVTWSSMNEKVAKVNATTGVITAMGKGATIIVGSFTDKWGEPRVMHILVGVGIYLSDNSDLGELLELIAEGEKVLAEKDGNGDSPYTQDSLDNLKDAVDQGKGVVDMGNPSTSQIKDAIDDLKDALANMQEKLGEGVIGPDSNGNYYKPVGRPQNVFEIVDRDGHPKHQPPQFVYNPTGDPVGNEGQNKPAIPEGGNYYVEDPDGSNIWKKVDDNGTLIQNPAIWGGPDGKPGGNDDEIAKPFGNGEYWIDRGQNVWQKVDPNNPRGSLGPLTGGGPEKNPAQNQVRPIYPGEVYGGKYYVGPLGPDADGDYYYYGDPANGNGTLDSLATPNGNGLRSDDVLYYLANGAMTTNKPSEIVEVRINPATVTVAKGASQSFHAVQIRRDGQEGSGSVTWSVTGGISGTTIDSNGNLTVAAGETAATLTVKAVSAKYPSISGTATVTVVTGIDPQAINRVEITPATAVVQKTDTQTFTAKVYRNNGTEDNAGVNWSVTGMGPGSTTSINSSGVLTVGANETAATLTVTAASKTTSSITATATVTVTAAPITEIPTGSDDRVLPANKAGDSSDWIEIAKNGGYSLIVRKNYINIYQSSGHNGDPYWQSTRFGTSSSYQNSYARAYVNDWFKGTAPNAAEKLGANARLRDFTVKSTAMSAIGSGATVGGNNDGFSKPLVQPATTGDDVAFLLSYGEAANFCSDSYMWDGTPNTTSSQLAKNNCAKIKASIPNIQDGSTVAIAAWLRSPGNGSTMASCLTYFGRVYQSNADGAGGEVNFIFPAVWVDSDIFN